MAIQFIQNIWTDSKLEIEIYTKMNLEKMHERWNTNPNVLTAAEYSPSLLLQNEQTYMLPDWEPITVSVVNRE